MRTQRDAIYRQVMERAWNDDIGAFTQRFDTTTVDASVLLMPMVKFIAPTDPGCSPTPTPVGLYSEEIGPRHELLGNFPQAFTHLSLMSAAFNLDRALSNRDSNRPR